MSRAVIYARFSCSKQREASIEDQLRVCHEWCDLHHHEVVAEYTDSAISGRTDNRPAFQAMIANAGEADLCVVYMMDRFSRDVYDAPIYKKRLRDKGCKVVSATEAMPDGPEALLIEKLYEGLAAIESAHTSERVKRGMKGNALKCMANGYRVFGYSIVDGFYEVNPHEAAIVREVFQRHNAGESSNSIARDLAARGIKTRHNNKVGYSFVYTMLHNEKYRGIYSWGEVRQVDGMPRIIDEGTWAQAQSVKPRRHSMNSYTYVLSGRAMCSECGYNLQGMSANGHGGTYHYYRCAKGHIKPPRADWLESALAAELRKLLNDTQLVHEIALEVEAYNNSTSAHAARDSAAKRLSDAQKVLENLTQAVADGMPYAMVKDRIEEAQEIVATTTHELEVAQQTDFSVEEFEAFLHLGSGLDDATLLDAMVYQVVVSDDSVIATLNFDLNDEPARLSVERVRGFEEWWAKEQGSRTFATIDGLIVLKLPRAA